MTKKDKLVIRFKGKPRDFTFNELMTLLSGFGYREITKGKTSGSRRAFINEKTGHIIRLHKPHPGNILKMYQLQQLLEEMEKERLL